VASQVLPEEEAGSEYPTEFFAISGVRARSVETVLEQVQSGKRSSALVVHRGTLKLDPGIVTTVLAKQGRTELIRVARKSTN
jgi:hypothetical protein